MLNPQGEDPGVTEPGFIAPAGSAANDPGDPASGAPALVTDDKDVDYPEFPVGPLQPDDPAGPAVPRPRDAGDAGVPLASDAGFALADAAAK